MLPHEIQAYAACSYLASYFLTLTIFYGATERCVSKLFNPSSATSCLVIPNMGDSTNRRPIHSVHSIAPTRIAAPQKRYSPSWAHCRNRAVDIGPQFCKAMHRP